MYTPSYRFDYDRDARIGLARDLCAELALRGSVTAITVWHYSAAKRMADQVGVIFDKILGSTLADLLGEQCFHVGTADWATFFAREDITPNSLDQALVDAEAWHLLVGHGQSVSEWHGPPPDDEKRKEALECLGAGPYWKKSAVRLLVPDDVSADVLVERWNTNVPKRTFSSKAPWPELIDLNH